MISRIFFMVYKLSLFISKALCDGFVNELNCKCGQNNFLRRYSYNISYLIYSVKLNSVGGNPLESLKSLYFSIIESFTTWDLDDKSFPNPNSKESIK